MTPIQVQFTFSERSYTEVSQYLVYQMVRQRRWLLYGLGAVLIVLALTALLAGRWQLLASFVIPLLLFLPIWRFTMQRLYKKAFAQQTNLQHPIEYVFKQDEIEFNTYTGLARLQWSTFQSAVETKDFFLLYLNPLQANPVLKTGFENAEAMEHFRALLQEKGLLRQD